MMQLTSMPRERAGVEERRWKKILLHSSKLAQPVGIFSSGVKAPAGHLVFVSGQVARNAAGETVGKGDIRAQTRRRSKMSRLSSKRPARPWTIS